MTITIPVWVFWVCGGAILAVPILYFAVLGFALWYEDYRYRMPSLFKWRS